MAREGETMKCVVNSDKDATRVNLDEFMMECKECGRAYKGSELNKDRICKSCEGSE